MSKINVEACVKLKDQFTSQAAKIQASTTKMGASFGKLASQSKSMAGSMAGSLTKVIAAVGSLTLAYHGLKKIMDATIRSESSGFRLKNAFRGDAKGLVSAKAFVSSLSKETGVDDEALADSLVQFKATFGKRSDLAQRALAASTNLGAYLKGTEEKDIEGTVKGIQRSLAKGKVGRMAAYIPGLQDSDMKGMDLAQRQALILSKLEDKYSGSAKGFRTETLEGRITGFKTAAENVLEAIGGALTGEGSKGVSIIDRMTTKMYELTDAIENPKSKLRQFFADLAPVGEAVTSVGRAIATMFGHVSQMSGGLQNLIIGIVGLKTGLLALNAVIMINSALFSASPIGRVIALIAGLTAGLTMAYQTSATFRTIVDGAFNAVAASVSTLTSYLPKVQSFFNGIIDAVKPVVEWIRELISMLGSMGSLVGGAISSAASSIPGIGSLFGGGAQTQNVNVNATIDGKISGATITRKSVNTGRTSLGGK